MMKHAISGCIFLMLAAGCAKKPVHSSPEYPVKVAEVREEDVPFLVKGIGQLIASVEVEIKAQVEGYLTNVLFDDGQLVEEGDLLMTIDPRIYEANLQAAQAQLAEDRARLRYALDFAETYGKLVGEEYVARLDYEQGVQNVDVFKAAIENDLAEIKKAQINLDYTQLRAPIKGYVGLRKLDPGNVVYPEITESLVTIRKITPLKVAFSLSSDYLQVIREQQKKQPLYIEATLPGDPAHPLEGVLYFIDNTVNEQTGMIQLEGIIPNEEERGWPGAFARVRLRLKTIKDALLIPKQAIVLGQDGNFVFVLDQESKTVEMRMIGKGFSYRDATVVEWGLNPGEVVVVDGQLNLYNGALVKVHE